MALASENSTGRQRAMWSAPSTAQPFQGPTHFDFAINMTITKALGLTIPPSFHVAADEVIE
jgi:hypothetical protein